MRTKPESYWIGKESAHLYSVPTEPELHPDKFVELVLKSDYEKIERRYFELFAHILHNLQQIEGDAGDYNSPLNLIALMVEGEGSDPEVYRQMSRSALDQIRKAFSEIKNELVNHSVLHRGIRYEFLDFKMEVQDETKG